MTRNYNIIMHIAKNWKLNDFYFYKAAVETIFQFFYDSVEIFQKKNHVFSIIILITHWVIWICCGYILILYMLFADIKIVI